MICAIVGGLYARIFESYKKALAARTAIRFLPAFLITGCTLFIPAGSLNYCNAWVLIAAIFIPMFFALTYLITMDPELLEKRMKAREKEERQKLVQKIGVVPINVGFLLPGFDYRYNLSNVPLWLVIIASIVLVLGYMLFVVVRRQNRYASRVIEIQENQRIIVYGLYSKVRHPMHTSSIIIFAFPQLVLGSYYAILPLALYPAILIIRIMSEEEVLKKELKGYEDYMKKVIYRLIALIC